jgi:hypothetical protein
MARAGAKKPKIKLPPDFASEAEFLQHMRKEFHEDTEADRLNREAALEDLKFMVGDQWDDVVRQRREAARKPTLTINRLPAFVAQIVGQRRQNETDLKIVPDAGENVSEARVREGLVRQIQKASRADIAYDNALQNQVVCGIGNFKLEVDYQDDDVFDQTLKVGACPDPLAVVWDRKLVDGTGRDATHCFEIFTLKLDEFEKSWPWATPSDVSIDITLRGDLRMNGWLTLNDVRVVAYWVMRTRKRTLALMNSGKTQDITDEVGNVALMQNIMQHADGTPVLREVDRKFAQMYLCSGLDVLEGPYELPISRVPYFRVPGWEVMVGEWKHRWGLIRFLKDPQRLHNYWRSVIAEKLMLTPRAGWVASAEAVAGREADWRNSHLSDDPLLIYNGEAGEKPERVQPADVQAALIGEAELTTQDIKDVSNIHEANLGMPSNEVSGAAISARQRVSDTGTVIYHDNLNQAIEECGRTMNELLPTIYDTARIVKVLGHDSKENMQAINDMGNPASVDITSGRYNVSVVTGPSYATKRMEAAESMKNLLNAMPQVYQYAADLFVEAQDWPMAEEIANRIRLQMDPAMLKPEQVTAQIAANAQAKAAAAAHQEGVAAQMAGAALQKTNADAALSLARARNYSTQADLAPSHADIGAAQATSQIQDRELRGNLEAIKVAESGG